MLVLHGSTPHLGSDPKPWRSRTNLFSGWFSCFFAQFFFRLLEQEFGFLWSRLADLVQDPRFGFGTRFAGCNGSP